MNDSDLSCLQQKLEYRFRRIGLLQEALCHRSFINEQPDETLADNERLEFLGDAVLNLVVGHILMQRFPDLKEGDLSRMRANLVNENRLAFIAGRIQLGNYLVLGKGEIATDGRRKKSILADAFEATLAAVYLDGGFDRAFALVEAHFTAFLDPETGPVIAQDFKSRLQEMMQIDGGQIPTYTVVGESGPDHEKTFRVVLRVRHIETEGLGKNKKSAEQDAARKALEILAPRS